MTIRLYGLLTCLVFFVMLKVSTYLDTCITDLSSVNVALSPEWWLSQVSK